MAIACFGFLTFLPEPPDRNLPSFISCIERSTLRLDSGLYLRPELFLGELFLRAVLLREDVFFPTPVVFRDDVFLRADVFFREDVVLRDDVLLREDVVLRDDVFLRVGTFFLPVPALFEDVFLRVELFLRPPRAAAVARPSESPGSVFPMPL